MFDMNSKKIRISTSQINNLFLCLFSIFIAIGVYWRINKIVIALYMLLAILIALKSPIKFKTNKIFILWIILCVDSFIMALLHGNSYGIELAIKEVVIFLITGILVGRVPIDKFIKLQRDVIVVSSAITLVDLTFHIGLSDIIKGNSKHVSIDGIGGISGIF
jgi:hypothetical protein